ncbi:hypothetical protein LXL04_014230 [Taraxacum kok-saghyz]
MSSTGATIGDLRSSLSSTTATRPPMSSTGATWMLASSKPIGYPSLPIRNFQFRYRPTYPLPLPPPLGPPRSCRHLHSNSDSIFTRSPIPLTHSKPRPVYTAAKSPADWKRNQRDAIITGIGEICGFQLRSFENSYIHENPRTPPIFYISQTVIPFKKTDFGTLRGSIENHNGPKNQ